MPFVSWPVFCIAFFVSGTAAAAEYERVTTRLIELQATHPERAELFDLGASDQGEMIKGLRILPLSAAGKDDIHHLIVGTHHGNERLSADVSLQIATDLLEEEADPRLAGITFHIIPVLNVGGFNRNSREERDGTGRSRDPNRDYPDPCVSKSNYHLSSTALLAEYVMSYEIVAAVTIHGYIGTFTYPWGIYTDQTHTHDHDTFDAIGRAAVALNGYRTGTHADLIYPAAGAFEDWAYHDLGVWTMLLELANRPDLRRDSAAVREFLALAPRQRSSTHAHTGNCTQTIDVLGISRP